MYIYFLTVLHQDLAKISSEEKAIEYLEDGNSVVGGLFSQVSLRVLFDFVVGDRLVLIPTQFITTIGESIDRVDFKFCFCLANTQHETLLELASQWAECDVWKGNEVNSMDLAGFLIEFASLCRYALAKKQEVYSVFILSSND
jgi:hypothetical protein